MIIFRHWCWSFLGVVIESIPFIVMGAIISSGSVVVKNVDSMSVISGNLAKEFKKRECVHSQLVVESLLGGDYYQYKAAKLKKLK